MKRCINPECGAELDDNAKFCPECGTKQPTEKKCPKCGTVVAEKAKFCPECGFKMDGTGAVPKAGGLSIGDNNAISAKDVIGGDKIEAQHYTVNNFMAAQKTEAEQKMDNISVKKMSKEYIRDEMNKAMNYEKQGDYYHAVEIYKDLAADDNSDAVCAMLKLDLRKKFQLSGIERNQMLGKISEIANTGHPEALFVVGAYKLETDKATGLQYIYAAAQSHSNDAIDYLDNYYGWNNADGTFTLPENITEEAFHWFEKSAQMGSAKGQYQLARCYYKGYFVDKNIHEAVKWYRKAADNGQVDAQYMMGVLYSEGDGVIVDKQESVKWFRKAAEQGDIVAQNNLGTLYYNGEDVEQDYKEALKWYKLAAEQGNILAQGNIGLCYYFGNGVTQNYEDAVKWIKLAADKGEGFFQRWLGICYYYGHGVNEDYNEAVKWFKLAAEQGDARAQYYFGHCYNNGDGVPNNTAEAEKWLKMAADNGDDDAKIELREIHKKNVVYEKEYIKDLLVAASNGDADALMDLGELYYKGNNIINKNWKNAAFLYHIAEQQGATLSSLEKGCISFYENTDEYTEMEVKYYFIRWFEKGDNAEALAEILDYKE